MRLDKVSGYFDVRVYNAKKTRDQREIASQDHTISFGVCFTPEKLPKEVSKYARPFDRKDGSKGMYVGFKISKGCRFFIKENGRVKQVERPQHAELENKRYEACIDFRELNGDPTKQEAYGYWANGILIAEAVSEMFADLNDEAAEPVPASETPTSPMDMAAAAAVGVQTVTEQVGDISNEELPF